MAKSGCQGPDLKKTGGKYMCRALSAAFLTACASAAYSAPVPKERLLKPPADATHYVVVSMAGKHGDQ